MSDKNKHGLSRYIPRKIAKDVRRRSKFACVICRAGLYQFEHIDPAFEDARSHDPGAICCLCGSCHDSVTRGHLSKEAIKEAYLRVQHSKCGELMPPKGPLDLHTGHAELQIGGLTYQQLPTAIVRYHGIDVISIKPGTPTSPAEINAIFTDNDGNEVLRLEKNTWIGSLTNWDIEIQGRQLTVRRSNNAVALQLEFIPPGKLKILRMDMRIGDCHVLASTETHVAGRYVSDSEIYWLHADIGMIGPLPNAAVIEFASPAELRDRWEKQKLGGQFMAESSEQIVFGNRCGAMVIPAGIAIGSNSGAIKMHSQACGTTTLSDLRDILFSKPNLVPEFISRVKKK